MDAKGFTKANTKGQSKTADPLDGQKSNAPKGKQVGAKGNRFAALESKSLGTDVVEGEIREDARENPKAQEEIVVGEMDGRIIGETNQVEDNGKTIEEKGMDVEA